MNNMWPEINLRGYFMWNLEPSCMVMNVEVLSRNDILQSKGMIASKFIVLNDIILILRKVIMWVLLPLGGSTSGPFFVRVNVIGLWTLYGTSLYEP